jgi:hypothetical protein
MFKVVLWRDSESRIATFWEVCFVWLCGAIGLGRVVVGFGVVNTGCGLEIIKGGGRERKRAIAMIAVWRMFRVSCLMSDSFMSVGF